MSEQNPTHWWICRNCDLTYDAQAEYVEVANFHDRQTSCGTRNLAWVEINAMNDMVTKPSHYVFGKYEVIDVLEDWFANDPLLWQVGKYIARAKYKGRFLEDLKKARFYLERRIAKEEANGK